MATTAPDCCPSCGADARRRPRGHCPRCLLRQGLDGGSLSLSHAGEIGAGVELFRLAASWRRSRPRSARSRGSCCATPTPGPSRPSSGRPIGPPRARRSATASTARSPAAAWARCSRAATPTSAATSPSRSSATTTADDARDGPPVRRGGADRRPAPAPGHRAGLRAGHLRRPPAVLLDEAGQGPDPRRASGRPAVARPTSCRGSWAIFEASLPDGGLRPRPRA